MGAVGQAVWAISPSWKGVLCCLGAGRAVKDSDQLYTRLWSTARCILGKVICNMSIQTIGFGVNQAACCQKKGEERVFCMLVMRLQLPKEERKKRGAGEGPPVSVLALLLLPLCSRGPPGSTPPA